MVFYDIYEKFEKLAPAKYVMSRDSTGFQIGRVDKEIKKVCLATDATDDVVEQALKNGAGLLLTHHSLIHSPLAQILNDDIIGRKVIKLIRNDINYMSIHTNFDVMVMADYAADILGLAERQVFYPTYDDGAILEGVGRFGKLPHKMTLSECTVYVKEKFKLKSVLVYGEKDKIITTAAICPGSSSGTLGYAVKAGVDLLITGDIKHSMALEALAHGISLIDAGHYGTEKIFVPFMLDYFKREMPQLEVFAAKESNPFYVV